MPPITRQTTQQFLLRFFLIILAAFSFGTVSKSALAANETPKSLTASELTQMMKSPDAKATAVNLWASWCAPCKEELPAFVTLKKKYAKDGFKLVLISADTKEALPEAIKILKGAGVDFQTYQLAEDPEVFMKNFAENWGAILPTTLLFDATGKRRAYQVGKLKLKDFENDLNKTLADQKKKGSK